MAWLAIANHQTVTLRLTEGIMHQRRSHWVDRSARECTGESCIYCKGGAKARIRWFMGVESAGELYTWEFPPAVRDHLIEALGGPDRILGGVVSVQREGEGLETRYRIVSVASGAVAGGSAQALVAGSPAGSAGALAAPVGGVRERQATEEARVADTATALFSALAAYQPTAVSAVADAVWGLLMSAPFLDAVSDGVVMKLTVKGVGEQSVLERMVADVCKRICDALTDAGLLPDDEAGGSETPALPDGG